MSISNRIYKRYFPGKRLGLNMTHWRLNYGCPLDACTFDMEKRLTQLSVS